MRVRLSGSTITAHGDNLTSDYVEFYGNEPLGFPTDWTVSGSAPNRVLKDPSGHEYARELPTQTAPGGGGGSISATDGTVTVNPATSIVFPAGTLVNKGGGVAGVGLVVSQVGPLSFAFNDPGIGVDGIVIGPVLPIGTLLLAAWHIPVVQWAGTAPNLTPLTCIAGIAPAATPTSPAINWSMDDIRTGGAAGPPFAVAAPWNNVYRVWTDTPTVAGVAAQLYVYVDPAVAGSSDLYAIIATPAS